MRVSYHESGMHHPYLQRAMLFLSLDHTSSLYEPFQLQSKLVYRKKRRNLRTFMISDNPLKLEQKYYDVIKDLFLPVRSIYFFPIQYYQSFQKLLKLLLLGPEIIANQGPKFHVVQNFYACIYLYPKVYFVIRP